MPPLDPTLQTVLAQYRASLTAQFGERLDAVTLFGSMARGDAHEDSDVDVLVVLNAPSDTERREAMDMAGRLGLEHDLVMSPVVLSRAEWQELKRRERRFAHEIEKEGIEI